MIEWIWNFPKALLLVFYPSMSVIPSFSIPQRCCVIPHSGELFGSGLSSSFHRAVASLAVKLIWHAPLLIINWSSSKHEKWEHTDRQSLSTQTLFRFYKHTWQPINFIGTSFGYLTHETQNEVLWNTIWPYFWLILCLSNLHCVFVSNPSSLGHKKHWLLCCNWIF